LLRNHKKRQARCQLPKEINTCNKLKTAAYYSCFLCYCNCLVSVKWLCRQVVRGTEQPRVRRHRCGRLAIASHNRIVISSRTDCGT